MTRRSIARGRGTSADAGGASSPASGDGDAVDGAALAEVFDLEVGVHAAVDGAGSGVVEGGRFEVGMGREQGLDLSEVGLMIGLDGPAGAGGEGADGGASRYTENRNVMQSPSATV